MLLNHIILKKNSLSVFFDRATLMVADQDGYSLIILGVSYIKINITCSSGKWSNPVNFLNSIYNFRC